MLFTIGFLLIFLLGGITGVMVAILPFDWQVTDSYFIVAHFHYVLNGAVVFPIFGAHLLTGCPKMTGRMLSERLGKISFWMMFIGFNVTFFPMHILGFLGMPRRVWTYSTASAGTRSTSSSASARSCSALGTGITLLNCRSSMRHGELAPRRPVGCATRSSGRSSSPPPDYNFAAIPVVASRHPLWDDSAPPRCRALGRPTRRRSRGRSLAREGAWRRRRRSRSGRDTRPWTCSRSPRRRSCRSSLAFGIAVFFVGLLIELRRRRRRCRLRGRRPARWVWRTDMDRT